MNKTTTIVALLSGLMMLGLASCGGSGTNGADVITAPDLDLAAQRVIDEMLPETAAELEISRVKTDAIAACGAIAEVPNAATGPQIVSKIAKPDYAPAVEAAGDDNIENAEFFATELPYVVALGKHFCPGEAVRANVI